MISVIIPVYKVEKYLRRCIDSAINQSYPDMEIILIDDGSPDKCGEICDEYAQKDTRIKVIHKENEGVCAARNSGIKQSKGEYIFFLDSDDFIDKQALGILYVHAYITDADITLGNYKVINEKNRIRLRKYFEKERLDREDLQNASVRFRYFFGKSYGVQVWNTLYKASFIRKCNILFEKKIYYGEDFLFNAELFFHYPKITLVNKYTYFYFENSESITSSFKKELTKQNIILVTCLYRFAKRIGKVKDNIDIISYCAFTAIDSSGLNIYQYSNHKLKDMLNEIREYKRSNIMNRLILALVKGRYIKDVPRKDWKIYAWIFSFLYSLNFIHLAVLLQMIRFKVRKLRIRNKIKNRK